MLEGVVASLLTTYLGAYTRDIDAKQLNIGVWGGNVELSNLELRTDALNALHLPVTVLRGVIGRLVVKADWKNLKTKPVIVELEDILLLAVPKNEEKYDPEQEAKWEQEDKLAQLNALEEAKTLAREQGKGTQEDNTFTARMIKQILDNLQVTIKNVHIRYEDTLPGSTVPFAVGLTIEKISSQSADAQWRPSLIQDDPPLLNKIADVKSLAVYWDVETTGFRALSPHALNRALLDLIAWEDHITPDLDYIVEPMSLSSKVVMNKKDAPDLTQPKFVATSAMERLDVRLDEAQYGQLLGTINAFAYYSRGYEHRHLRPDVPITRNARAWWNFAIQAHLEKIRKRNAMWRPRYFEKRWKRKKMYIEIWKTRMTTKKFKLTKANAEKLAALEEKLSFDDVKFFRSLAEVQLKEEDMARKVRESRSPTKQGSWIWGNSSNAAADPPEAGVEEFALSPEQRAVLYSTLDLTAHTNTAPEDYVYLKFDFKLDLATVLLAGPSVKSEDGQRLPGEEIIMCNLTNLNLQYIQRPKSLKLASWLGSFVVFDRTVKDTHFPVVVRPQEDMNTGDDANLLRFSYELKPLHVDEDADVHLYAKPLMITYNSTMGDRLAHFLRDPQSAPVTKHDLAIMQAEEIKSLYVGTSSTQRWGVENRVTMQISVHLEDPIVMVPLSVTTTDTDILILDLKSLALRSSPDREGSDSKLLYHNFNVTADEIQVALVSSLDEAKLGQYNDVDRQLIEPFDATAQFSSSRLQQDVTLPATILAINCPTLRGHISTSKYVRVMSILRLVLPDPLPPPPPPSVGEEGGQKVDDATLAERQLMDLKINIKSMDLALLNDSGSEPIDVGVLSILDACVSVTTFTYTMELLIKSDTLELTAGKTDRYAITTVNHSLKSLTSPRSCRPVSIRWLYADPTCPVFTTLFNNTCSLTEVSANDVFVDVDAAILANIVELLKIMLYDAPITDYPRIPGFEEGASDAITWWDYISEMIVGAPEAKLKNDAKKYRTYNTQWREYHTKVRATKGLDTPHDMDLIFSKFLLHVHHSDVQLNSVGGDLHAPTIPMIRCEVSEVAVDFKANYWPCETIITATDLSVFNISSGKDQESTLLWAGGRTTKDVLSMRIDQYDTWSADNPGYDALYTIVVDSVKAFVLRSIYDKLSLHAEKDWATVANCVTSPPLTRIGSNDTDITAADEPTGEAFTGRMKLDVRVRSPSVLIPQSATSVNVLCADLGPIAFGNEIKDGDIKLDVMEISLNDLTLKSTTTDDSVSPRIIVERATLTTTVERTLEPTDEVPDTVVRGLCQQIEATIRETDYALLMDVWAENLGKDSNAADDEGDPLIAELLEGVSEEQAPEPEGAANELRLLADDDAATNRCVLDMSWELHEAVLRLVNTGSQSEPSKLITAKVYGSQVLVKQQLNEAMMVIADIAGASVRDDRPGEQLCRDLFSCGNESESDVPGTSVENPRLAGQEEQSIVSSPRQRGNSFTNTGTPLVHVTYETSARGLDPVVDLHIAHSRALVAVDIIDPLQEFAAAASSSGGGRPTDTARRSADVDMSALDSPSLKRLSVALGGGSQLGSPSLKGKEEEESTVALPTEKDPVLINRESYMGELLKVRWQTVGFECCIVEDPNLSDPRALVVSSGGSGQYERRPDGSTVNAVLSNLTVTRCYLSHEAVTTSRVVRPCDVKVDLDLTPTKDAIGRDVTFANMKVDGDDLHVRASYQDLLLVQLILNDMNKILYPKALTEEHLQDLSSVDPTYTDDLISETQSQMSELVNSDSDDYDFSDEDKSQAPSGAAPGVSSQTPRSSTSLMDPSEIPLRDTERAKVKFSSVRVVLFDDEHRGRATPLLSVKVGDIDGTVRDWSSALSAGSAIYVTAEHYNTTLSAWEPVMEPWSAALSITASEEAPLVCLNSTQMLDVNVTNQLLHTINAVQASLSTEFVRPENIHEDVVEGTKPYRIKNLTGLECFWATEALGVTQASRAFHLLQPGAEEAFFFPFDDDEALDYDVTLTNPHDITIQVDAWNPLERIPVDAIGTKVYPLQSGTIETQAKLLVSVENQDNKMIVTLSSVVWLHNLTSVPLNVILDVPSQHVDPIPDLEPNERRPLRVDYALLARARVRPLQLDEPEPWTWSDCEVHWSLRERRGGKKKKSVDTTMTRWYPTTRDYLGMAYCTEPRGTGQVAVLKQFELAKAGKKISSSMMKFKKRMSRQPVVEELNQPKAFVMGVRVARNAKYRVAPAHTYTFFPPVVISNALAIPLKYSISITGRGSGQRLRGVLPSGGEKELYDIHPSDTIQIEATFAGYHCRESAVLFHPGRSMPGSAEKSSLILLDKKDRPFKLSIDRADEECGTKRVTLFCPYWIVNETGLPLLLSQAKGRGIDTHTVSAGQQTDLGVFPTQIDEPPFMFSYPTEMLRNTASIQINNSKWSKAFAMEAIGSRGALEMQATEDDTVYQIGISIDSLPGAFHRVKLITFTPRFVIMSLLEEEIYASQVGARGTLLTPRQRIPLHCVKGLEKFLSLRFWEEESPWCGPFPMTDVGVMIIKMFTKDHVERLLTVEVRQVESTTLLMISGETTTAPFQIDNLTDVSMSFFQKGFPNNARAIHPGESIPYTWDAFSGTHKLMLMLQDGRNTSLSLEEVGSHDSPFKGMRMRVEARGPVRVLRITGNAKRSVRTKAAGKMASLARSTKLGRKMRKSMMKRKNKGVKKAKRGALKRGEVVHFTIRVEIAGVGLSIIDDSPMELLYITIRKMTLDYRNTSMQGGLYCSFGSIQADNQMPHAMFPVALAPTESKRLAFELSAVKNNTYTDVDFFEYMSVLLQEMDALLDEKLLVALMEMAADMPVIGVERTDNDPLQVLQERRSLVIDDDGPERLSRRVYCGLMLINAMKVNVSIGDSGEMKGRHMRLLPGMVIPNVDRAPVKLNSLMLEHLFSTRNELGMRIQKHYKYQALEETYKLLGSFDFLGNPVGLFSNLATGVGDFFLEPAKGMVESPKAFGVGMAKGTASLVKNSVYGVFNTATKVTGSIGRTIGKASMDSDYIESRKKAERRQAKHLGDGLAQGFYGLGKGIFDGVTGLVVQPVKGARDEGAKGFAKGVGKGLVGVVVKPVAGCVDLATKTTEGIRNTTTYFESDVPRVRPPRVFDENGLVLPYDLEVSLAQYTLWEAKRGKFAASNVYVCHAETATIIDDMGVKDKMTTRGTLVADGVHHDRLTLIVGSRHVMVADTSKGSCLWAKPHKAFSRIHLFGSDIELTFDPARMMSKVGSKTKVVSLPSKEIAGEVFAALREARENARQALDEDDEDDDE